jgi:hypothetical protein
VRIVSKREYRFPHAQALLGGDDQVHSTNSLSGMSASTTFAVGRESLCPRDEPTVRVTCLAHTHTNEKLCLQAARFFEGAMLA